ncbi:MAG TPA: F0F1 ATP synthase subunit epsilon [Bryobacteraceae bacterium]|nr:F0F1 ATP synthase subunit epsilon [Bryobacteraceae bacterium]
MPLDLEVVTPERELVHEQVDEVQVPGRDGYLGILPGHAAMLGELGIGELSYKTGGREHYLAVLGGFLEVRGDHVRVLADEAEKPEEIDLEKARAEAGHAQVSVTNPALGLDPAEAVARVLRAQTRIAVAQKRGGAASH